MNINRLRVDSGSYSQKIIEEVSKYCQTFYIRVGNSKNHYQEFAEIKDWKKVEINYDTYEVTSVVNDTLAKGKTFRPVVCSYRN